MKNRKSQMRGHIEHQERPTLGGAVDLMIVALDPLDSRSRQTALSTVCYYLGVDLREVVRTAQKYGLVPVAQR